jgi:hypothetical protein
LDALDAAIRSSVSPPESDDAPKRSSLSDIIVVGRRG